MQEDSSIELVDNENESPNVSVKPTLDDIGQRLLVGKSDANPKKRSKPSS
jgi:hypothetical protein